jgi:hypothetical protein
MAADTVLSAGERVHAMKVLLKVAWFLGAAPLMMGVLIFLLWVQVRAHILVIAGLIVSIAGPFCILAATVCLTTYLRRMRKSQEVPGAVLTRQTVALVILFIANFVVAGGCFFGAIAVDTCYCVSVTNQSPQPLESARLSYGSRPPIQIGVIAPGSTVTKHFWVDQDGTLVFNATSGAATIAVTVDGYVTGNMGGRKEVVIDASNNATVYDKHVGLFSR